MSTLITKEEIITLRETGGTWFQLNWEGGINDTNAMTMYEILK